MKYLIVILDDDSIEYDHFRFFCYAFGGYSTLRTF